MKKLLLPLIYLVLLGTCFGQTKGKTNVRVPVPIQFSDIQIGGELLTRAMKNFDRLESDIYHPENVYQDYHHQTPDVWAADKEGRIILGLVLDARATHRTPVYLEKIMEMLPQKLNAKGYLGQINKDTLDEQQLSGHGWLLRALCEYYEWKKSPEVKKYITGIIKNLVLPTKGFHKKYPIDPANRIKNAGQMAGTSQNVISNWNLSSDVGCDFIFMDGVVHAYSLFPSKALKQIIDEMITRFFEMDVVAIKAQTHATLTGLRGAIRYYSITGNKKLLMKIEERYKLYRNLAMTENYENFNWFERPEWTEPCAIVDSYLLSVQLWQYTQQPSYLEDAQHIYYNAICHTQRSNGGFGCDNCPGPIENFLSVKVDEAYWCCTMRGSEGLSRTVQYNYFINRDTIIIPSFNSSKAYFRINDKKVVIDQQTEYPFSNKVILKTEGFKGNAAITLKIFIPGWIKNISISKNGEACNYKEKNESLIISSNFKSGDVLEFSFNMKSGIAETINRVHTRPGLVSLYYGPLLLGYDGNSGIVIPSNTEIVKQDNYCFVIKNKNIILSPVYHQMDKNVCQSSLYKKQVLFKVTGN